MDVKQFDNTKCYWTHNIAEELECSQDGKFDMWGFANTLCPYRKYCDKYQNEVMPQYKVSEIKKDENSINSSKPNRQNNLH